MVKNTWADKQKTYLDFPPKDERNIILNRLTSNSSSQNHHITSSFYEL